MHDFENLKIADQIWRLDDCCQLSTGQAAQLLKQSPATLKAWRHKQIGPKWIRKRPVTYSLGDLKKFLHAQKTGGA